MKLLCIDTASDICGVSILENNNLIVNLDNNTGRTHSENLMPLIQKAFDESNISLKDIDLIVCDMGPGSFTGIRIGMATAKAFHDSLDIPCLGISSLEALAYNVVEEKDFYDTKKTTLICSMINCKNNNCYFALYEKNNNGLFTLLNPQKDNINALISILNCYIEDNFEEYEIIFVGDGSKIFENLLRENFQNMQISKSSFDSLNSYNLGIAGLNKYENCYLPDEEFLPLYLNSWPNT